MPCSTGRTRACAPSAAPASSTRWRPDAPDAAAALQRLLAHCDASTALFAGDDANGETVFAAAPDDWLTVRVGRSDIPTRARFRLHGPGEMALLLQRLRVLADVA